MNQATEVVIRPTKGIGAIDLHGLWRYRDLLSLLVWRDFVSKYKQTILGPLWFILQPLLTTLIFTLIFGKVANLGTDGLPGVLFYLCGLVPWNYYAQNFNSISGTFVNNANLFGKVYFPRLVVPISALISNLLAFSIQLATFFVFYAIYKVRGIGSFGVTWEILWLPLLTLHVAAFSLGVGLWLSALTAKYRDLSHLGPLLVQLWMYATPIILPLSGFPLKWRWLIALNPLTPVVEAFRHALLGSGTVVFEHMVYSIIVTTVILISGLLLFGRVQKTFVDTI